MASSEKNAESISGSAASTGGPGPKVMAADTLTGEKVVTPAGEPLGEITHIMLDVVNGTIAYAEVSPDYTIRPDPSEMLPPLKALQAATAA